MASHIYGDYTFCEDAVADAGGAERYVGLEYNIINDIIIPASVLRLYCNSRGNCTVVCSYSESVTISAVSAAWYITIFTAIFVAEPNFYTR